MQVGPFPKRDIDDISKILQDAGIPFEIHVDQAAVDAALEEVKNRAPDVHVHQPSDPATHFYEIPDSRISDLGNLLEPFGVNLADDPDAPDFAAHEDYYCPVCKHHSTTKVSCPKHGVMMLTYEERTKYERENEKEIVQKRGFWIGLALAAGALAYYFVGRG